MNKQQKKAAIALFKPIFDNMHFYITNCDGLSASQMYRLRSMLYKKNVKCKLIPNALLRIFLTGTCYEPLCAILKKNSTILFVQEDPSTPAKVIKEFRENEKNDKPLLKGAWVDGEPLVGAAHFDALVHFKSKEELISEIVDLLESPLQTVMGGLQNAQESILGVLDQLTQIESF